MTQEIVEVTDAEITLIFAPMRHEFHCNAMLCGYTTEIAADALDHMVTEHQTELDWMAADLEAYQNGEPMPFRYTDAQLREMEEERPGEHLIAPYIAF